MTHYRATSPEGVVTEYDAELPQPEHLTEGWRLEDVSVAEPAPDAPPPEPQPQEWTAVEFLRRFTPTERITARAARKTDAVLDDFYALLEQAPVVHSIDPDVALGLGYMTQQGYLAVGRAEEILHG